MSLFTLVSSLLRPNTTAQRVQRQRPRTRLNLETLEDRRLLSGFHGSGHGFDDVQPVEIEHTGTSLDTPSVTRGLDDNTISVSTGSHDTSSGSRGLDDNSFSIGGVSDRRGGEGETGGRRGRGPANGKPVNTPKSHHPRRHGASI